MQAKLKLIGGTIKDVKLVQLVGVKRECLSVEISELEIDSKNKRCEVNCSGVSSLRRSRCACL